MNQIMEKLKELTSDVLCKMFFLIEEAEPIQKNFVFKYGVCLENNKFSMILLFTEKIAYLLTENFLGTKENSEEDIFDTLKEALNIIAGNFIGLYMKNLSDKVPVPYAIKNINELKTESYPAKIMFFNENPLKLMFKIKE